jgi:hypothetical protein
MVPIFPFCLDGSSFSQWFQYPLSASTVPVSPNGFNIPFLPRLPVSPNGCLSVPMVPMVPTFPFSPNGSNILFRSRWFQSLPMFMLMAFTQHHLVSTPSNSLFQRPATPCFSAQQPLDDPSLHEITHSCVVKCKALLFCFHFPDAAA